MSNMSKKDVNQIQKTEHDDESGAKKVIMVNTDFSIELDHKDGDSVTSHIPGLIAQVTAEPSDTGDLIPPLNCQTMKRIRVDIEGTGSVNVMVSPNDTGDYFYQVGNAGDIIDVCARRVKVVVESSVDGKVHLVGQG